MRTENNSNPSRRITHSHPDTTQTRFTLMSVEANQIKARYNILAGLFAWITCAGFITLPNTFTSLQNSSTLAANPGGRAIQQTIKNLSLLPLAGAFCLLGLAGTCFLWRTHQTNYIWLISHLFLPGLSHSFICLLSIALNIISIQGGHLSITANIAIITVTLLCGAMLCLTVIYYWLLSKIIATHNKENC
ncbi:uncharacterized protein F4822DRAFT_439307 [Hypoxylon trugodes]|uniref:uncharacterized protein n=1 Tax=Hypoxylon trugodes TaxID=326681 RepID=UPI0021A22A80|nr:uncharacterized protein F4822DRAFT_439307 [Hypoxylon trugodes]KAI1382559.1 hypothetical protein F4822DRAFT_439307 [Hypoxylon trugodes]